MLNTLQNTPWWVYAILLLLCYYGIKALTPTRESKTSLLVTPPILLAWSLYSLNLTLNPPLSLTCWLTAVLIGSLAALLIFSRKGIELDDSQTGLILPGSLKTLVLYLVFFAVNYYFGYQAAVQPELSATLQMVLFKACASGFASGLFCGRTLKLYRIFQTLKPMTAA
ncbi:hypothetical protein BK666_08710 [Pseudomonas frederiksbergensis]|uniref:DUF1453 domain-containing protein n=1 Tax=Pseudomonas frederiksbergensis TaxID=104087 RepID=A0A423K9C1_9PSED|nr:DUF6622 family protein [Pseudomonas frederiksbergensis]RON48495.1 hypothetical protein BK666_08710 [Pseudomonas frederiksbergensis]